MKFDPLKWNEVKDGQENECIQGMLHVMCSQDAAVYVEVEGVEALAGTGRNVKVEISTPFRFRVETKGRAFVANPCRLALKPTGEVFTNADRLPMESGTMAEVTKALRQFKLEQRQSLAELRTERRALKAERDRRETARRAKAEIDAAQAHEADQASEPDDQAETQEETETSGSE